MEKEKIINLIKGRIEDEQRKHPLLDWSRIAAIKIYTEWFEYFNNENKELQEKMANKKYTADDMMKVFEYGKTLEPFDCFEDFINSLNKQDLPIINGSYGCTIETLKNKQD